MKGSQSTELILWCFVLLPGLLYSIWRHTSVYYGCSKCGAANVVPIESPVAKKFLQMQRLNVFPFPSLSREVGSSVGVAESNWPRKA